MKGAFVVSLDHNLFGRAKAALISRGGEYLDALQAVQVRNKEGALFMIEASAAPDWEFREGPFKLKNGATLPDMASVTGCAIECRSEEYFAELVREIAGTPGAPVYVIDGDGDIWPGETVDPQRVRL